MPDTDIADRLARRTLELVDIPSESRNETEVMAYVRDALALEAALATGEVIFATTPPRGRELVVLAGHVDTVPAQGNVPGRIEDGSVVGLGASDMKGGVAVMLEVAAWAASAEPAFDLGFLFFTREELPPDESPVPSFLAENELVRSAALAIVLEPTDNQIHAGCIGNLGAELVFEGTSAHSARPWLGVNAIHEAVTTLAPLAELEPVDVDAGGLVFREVISVVGIEGGIADNVVPARCVARLNYRYAPGRSAAEAEARIRDLAGDAAVEVFANSPPAPVVIDRPLVERLRSAGGFEVAPKQAWTPVAQFAEAGIDAVNLGPGPTRYAHKADEQVPVAELVRTYEALLRFAGDTV